MLANLILALEITAMGMGLVFLAIVLLWLMMWALTALPFKESDETAEPAETGEVAGALPAEYQDLMTQAAAVAVAIALAEQSQSVARPLPEPPTALVSAWQLGMRTRQMYEKGGR
ncbi:MAG TPA: OadG family protein [Anaerolineales bacterium]|jgi:Na+-transporting methylmalonyl-CoA/oxaloacetate decarboxylase gamma subunit